MLTRMDKISLVLSELVGIMYLIGAWASTAYTFTDGHFDQFLKTPAATIGIGVACAIEVHFYLTQRLVKKAIDKRDFSTATKLQMGTLVALASFGIYNNYRYLIDTWQGHSLVETLIRSVGVYAFFILSSGLVSATKSVSEHIKDSGAEVQRLAVQTSTRQWKKKIVEHEKAGKPIAGVMTSLLRHDGETDAATRIDIITSELNGSIVPVAQIAPSKRVDGGMSKKESQAANQEKSIQAQRAIAENPKMTIDALAHHLGVSRSVASKFIKQYRQPAVITNLWEKKA